MLVFEPKGVLKGTPRLNDFAEFENVPDNELWDNFSKGNSGVLIYLYHKYVAQLLRFGIQFASRETVKDSIQDLFLYLKERKNQSGEVKNIAAYLYKILYRLIRKKVEYSLKFSSIHENNELQNWHISISKDIKFIEAEHKKEQSKKLERSLNNLSDKQRQALLLYYYEGFTHQEITDIMDLKNKSSVRKLIYRALDALKNNIVF
ncbi:MAG: sigma-70 family RNA polymerase sigma factor [Cyclobacteriaceae bacterium]|nr:sigma-70 family RNA polymerase sigma factor [Cyclobacteriaceae bacterium]